MAGLSDIIAGGLQVYDYKKGQDTSRNVSNEMKQAAEQGIGAVNKYLDPYAQAGQRGLQGYEDLLQDPSSIQQNPGYQWRLQQGQQALERSAAAKGETLSGGTLASLTEYGQGYASNEYDKALSREQTLATYGLQAGQAAAPALADLYGDLGEASAARELMQLQNRQTSLEGLAGLGGSLEGSFGDIAGKATGWLADKLGFGGTGDGSSAGVAGGGILGKIGSAATAGASKVAGVFGGGAGAAGASGGGAVATPYGPWGGGEAFTAIGGEGTGAASAAAPGALSQFTSGALGGTGGGVTAGSAAGTAGAVAGAGIGYLAGDKFTVNKDSASSEYGGKVAGTVGGYLFGPIGGAAAGLAGSIIGNVFGALTGIGDEDRPDFDIMTTSDSSKTFRSGDYVESAFGKIGFNSKSTRNLGGAKNKQMLKGFQPVIDMDNDIASVLSPEEVSAVKAALENSDVSNAHDSADPTQALMANHLKVVKSILTPERLQASGVQDMVDEFNSTVQAKVEEGRERAKQDDINSEVDGINYLSHDKYATRDRFSTKWLELLV